MTLLGRGIGIADGMSGSGIFVYYKYQLKCKKAPEVDDGIIAWSEASSAQGQPSSKQTRLDCSGPNKDEVSSSALTVIKATISSSLLGASATSTSIPKLGIAKDNPPPAAEEKDKYDPYSGAWLKSTEKQAVFFRDRKLEELSPGTVGVTYNLSGEVATAGLSYAGFKFEGMTVGQGSITNNERTFNTKNTTGHSAEGTAKANLGVGAQYGLGASTDLIGEHLKIDANGSAGFSATGTMEKKEDYEKKDAGTANERWESTSNFTSTIAGSVKVEWVVIVQRKKKTERYLDGTLMSTTETDWEDQ